MKKFTVTEKNEPNLTHLNFKCALNTYGLNVSNVSSMYIMAKSSNSIALYFSLVENTRHEIHETDCNSSSLSSF